MSSGLAVGKSAEASSTSMSVSQLRELKPACSAAEAQK